MKICIKSDLHHEFYRAGAPECSSEFADADVLVLAGDIDTGLAGAHWASAFLKIPVVYVPGNHEFYGFERNDTLRRLRQSMDGSHVHVLDRNAVAIQGVRFLGATLWTDYKLLGEWHQQMSSHEAECFLNDHRMIDEEVGEAPTQAASRFLPLHALQEHEASVAWLREQLAIPFDGKTVVVTHHGPNELSVPPRYRGNSLSPAFVSNLPLELFDVPVLWCHGHVHDSCCYRVGNCQVVCNPRGYPLNRQSAVGGFENQGYREDLSVEI